MTFKTFGMMLKLILKFQEFLESQGIEVNPPEKMPLDPYTELRKEPVRKYITPSDFDQLKQFLTFDKQVSDLTEKVYICFEYGYVFIGKF